MPHTTYITRWTLSVLSLSAVLIGSVSAAAPAPSPAQHEAADRYAQERAQCQVHNTQDSLATCLREAAAARDAARKGDLTTPGALAERNATQRCMVFHTPADQAECQRRMQATPIGSVEDGGLLRESVTTTVVRP